VTSTSGSSGMGKGFLWFLGIGARHSPEARIAYYGGSQQLF
jgi:hypothetical protein